MKTLNISSVLKWSKESTITYKVTPVLASSYLKTVNNRRRPGVSAFNDYIVGIVFFAMVQQKPVLYVLGQKKWAE